VAIVIPSAATRRWLSRSARQYAYALWMAVLITVISVKMWWLTDPALVTALNGPYGSLVAAGAFLIAACIGIQRFAQPEPLGDRRTSEGTHGQPEA
jgi:hypothetical protein